MQILHINIIYIVRSKYAEGPEHVRHHSLEPPDLALLVHQLTGLQPRALPRLHVGGVSQPARPQQAEGQI